jgi:glutathione peroxidase
MNRAIASLLAALALSVGACSSADHGEPDAAAPASPAAEAPATEAAAPADEDDHGLYALATTTLEGEPAPLSAYAGKVALVVNVASRCGFTPQYAGLETLAQTYADRGLVVLGFPSNEFGQQEPGTPQEIREFCTSNFGVTFPLFSKQLTQPGEHQSPVYAFLYEATGEAPDWNFCKYLVGRDGQVLGFWRSRTTPDDPDLTAAIEKALGS